jgi:hypothetical protein
MSPPLARMPKPKRSSGGLRRRIVTSWVICVDFCIATPHLQPQMSLLLHRHCFVPRPRGDTAASCICCARVASFGRSTNKLCVLVSTYTRENPDTRVIDDCDLHRSDSLRDGNFKLRVRQFYNALLRTSGDHNRRATMLGHRQYLESVFGRRRISIKGKWSW